MKRSSILVLLVIVTSQHVFAGTVTSVGSVNALTVSQLGHILGTADFNDACCYAPVPSDRYATSGMILQGVPGNSSNDVLFSNANSFSTIFPGIVSAGHAVLPAYEVATGLFPPPQGGGQQTGAYAIYGLVATFSVPVTQFGLTLSKNGVQYITAWRTDGTLIGQVKWQPAGDASFVGLSSGSTPIAMVAVGNDDVFAGEVYDFNGPTPCFDNAVWAVPEPSIFSLALAAVAITQWHRQHRHPRAHLPHPVCPGSHDAGCDAK